MPSPWRNECVTSPCRHRSQSRRRSQAPTAAAAGPNLWRCRTAGAGLSSSDDDDDDTDDDDRDDGGSQTPCCRRWRHSSRVPTLMSRDYRRPGCPITLQKHQHRHSGPASLTTYTYVNINQSHDVHTVYNVYTAWCVHVGLIVHYTRTGRNEKCRSEKVGIYYLTSLPRPSVNKRYHSDGEKRYVSSADGHFGHFR